MSSMKFQARLRLNEEEQLIENLECWVHELLPPLYGNGIPGDEWVMRHFQDLSYEQCRESFELPADNAGKSYQVLFHGQLRAWQDPEGEWDDELTVDEAQFAELDMEAERKADREAAAFRLTLEDDACIIRNEFQYKVDAWIIRCFGPEMRADIRERAFRFFEEATELVQTLQISKEDCRTLVNYVFDRPAGDIQQEIGGVMTTLAALCNAKQLDMMVLANREITRVNTTEIIEKVRAKNANKPCRSGALPGTA